ncbi:hypothetical protein C8J56DRAFT_888553 [Mycena floridula]|nr:hypothetical protein C8J56DRAFT_888553 [Mycena floridula]
MFQGPARAEDQGQREAKFFYYHLRISVSDLLPPNELEFLTPLYYRDCQSQETMDGHAEDLVLDQGMVEQLGMVLQYLPPGPQRRSAAEIKAFSQLSRVEQRAANQARLVKCGWTDQDGLQSCTVVASAKDMRKHIEMFHNIPRPHPGEPPRVCQWIHCGSSERHLYKHIGTIHLGLQQSACDYCDREFSRTDQVKAHMESCDRRGN